MIDLEIIKAAGGTPERLKQVFDRKNKGTHKIREPIERRIRSRIGKGVTHNLNNFRYWYACDLAWDIPFQQTTATLMRGLIDRSAKSEDVLKVLEGHDVSNMIRYRDKDGNITTDISKRCTQEVHAPTFFQIFFPLAKSYTTIRAAAVVNAYRQTPLFQYVPLKSTKSDRARCEVITDRVERMSVDFDYRSVFRQSVLHAFHYGQAVLFPKEEWYREYQMQAGKDSKPEKKLVKEGLRFHIPHPSRTFYDLTDRVSTMNSDIGVGYAGYWRITAWGEVKNNKSYWNMDRVALGQQDFISSNPAYFNTVYNTCALKFPSMETGDKRDREGQIEWYTDEMDDKAILLTEYCEKLSPKDFGLFDYEYPIWFRFVVASDDTVVYCAPVAYTPSVLFSYDALETRSQNPSLTLECLPTQDHVNNLFSQYILSVKQNLANCTFYDTNLVDPAVIDKIVNLGESYYRSINAVPSDSQHNARAEKDLTKAFHSFTFPRHDTSQLLQGVREMLTMLERTLVMSPQELAQTATHEQTAEEVKTVNVARSTRYEFTASGIDSGVYALKRLLYEGLMAYGSEEIYATLPLPVSRAALEKLGFTVDEDESDEKHIAVKGNKTALALEGFASTRDGDLRPNNVAIAQAMTQLLQTFLSNEALFQEIGAEKVVDFMNMIAQTAGLPRDFQFIANGSSAGATQQMLLEQLNQMALQIQNGTLDQTMEVLKPMAEMVAQNRKDVEAMQAQLSQLAQLMLPPAPPPALDELAAPAPVAAPDSGGIPTT